MAELISVHVKPSSKKSGVLGFDKDRILRVEVKAPAQDGRANIELIKLLSKYFERQTRIKSGLSSKNKIIELS